MVEDLEKEKDGCYIIVNKLFIFVQTEQPMVSAKSLKGNRIEQLVMLQWAYI